METGTKVAIVGGALLLGAGLYFTFMHKDSSGMTLAQRIRFRNGNQGRPNLSGQHGADGYETRQDEGNMTAVMAKAGVVMNATGDKCTKRANSPGHPCIEWKDKNGNLQSAAKIKKDKYNQKIEDLKKQGLVQFADGHGFTLV